MVHSIVQNVEQVCQKDSMGVQGTPECPQMQKGSMQKVEAAKECLGVAGDFCLTIFKKGKKEDAGNCMSVSLTAFPGRL